MMNIPSSNSLVYHSISSLALEEVKGGCNLPRWIYSSVHYLQQTHLLFFYRSYKITKYVNPRDAIFLGGALYTGSRLLGLSLYLKVALYIKCVLDLFERYDRLSEAYQNLVDAIYFTYPSCCVNEWDFEKERYSSSLKVWWQTTASPLKRQLGKTIRCAALFFIEIVKLSFYLRDLYLLTQNDATTQFYACSELADDLWNHCQNLEKNSLLILEQFRSEEALGNRLIKKLGLKRDMSSLINCWMEKHSFLIQEIQQQCQEASEDLRLLFSSGIPRFSIGKNRPREIPQCRFVPWLGQEEI